MDDKNLVPKEDLGNLGNIYEKSIDAVMHESMMPYSEYVILDRALPRVEDGLKPVQRRILYSMMELGLSPDKPHKKSARIVGECLGKFHPHGDRSVYDAMVRMAQPFNMRMMLVDGHGNYGSIDGDTPASMRYTEARLQSLTMELLRDLDKNTVNWSFNFDDTLKEPDTLPGRFPNLLVNGAMGIAVGLATNIPTHNLTEVIDGVIAMIDKPKITLPEMMKIIKGPDFSTGGYLICGEELETAYRTGRGKVTMRAKIQIEEIGTHKAIVITELPYQVNKSTLLQKIFNLREEKREIFGVIREITDESDRNGIRAVLRIQSNADPDALIKHLTKHTDLQLTFGINMVAIANGKPEQLGLLEILRYYIDYQTEVVRRRTAFDLKAAKDREHILKGLVIAVENIDEVIKIIRGSRTTAQAREKLKQTFVLDDIQAQAILDMRLARLTGLEIDKLKDELEAIRKLIVELTAILKSHRLQMDVIKTELNDIKRTYKCPRLTELVDKPSDIVDPIVDDSVPFRVGVVICDNQKRTIKCVSERSYSMYRKDLKYIGENDFNDAAISASNQKDVLVFTSLGNIFKLKLDNLTEVKMREKGMAYEEVFKEMLPKEKIVKMYTFDNIPEKGSLYQFTAKGMIKRSKWTEYDINKPYFQSIVLKDGDYVIACEDVKKKHSVFFVTEKGMCLNAKTDDVPEQGRRSGGVKGVVLGQGDKIAMMTQVDDTGEIVIVTDKGYAKRVLALEIDPMNRHRKGVKIMDFTATNGTKVMHASYVKEPYNIALIKVNGEIAAVNTDEIRIEGRTSKGRSIMKEKGILKAVRKYFNE